MTKAKGVEGAVLAALTVEAQASPMGQVALVLARRMDDPGQGAAAVAAAARELRMVLAAVGESESGRTVDDPLAAARAARAVRRAGAAGS